MALYDTRFGLPQAVANYLNQGLPDIYQNIYNPPSIGPITKLPVEPDNPLVDPLYPQTGGNAEGFSVYNPDPNRTRTQDNYSPYAYRQASERSYIGAPGDYSYSSGTAAQKMMDNYPEYYEGRQLEGIPGAIQGYLKNSLAGQLIGKAVSGIESLLPVNRRAIIENEALGSGFRLNDIGQIVAAPGSAYDPSGLNIMAGYNLAKIDQSTFDKRRERAKKNMTPEGYEEFNKALTAAEEKILGPKSIKSKSDLIFDDKSLQKDPTYKSFDDLVTAGLLEGDNDDEYEFDPTDPKNFFKVDPVSRKSAIDQEAANRNVQREIARRNAAKESAIAQEISNREAARQAAKTRASSIAQETSNRDAAREAARKSAARKSAVAQETSNRDYARNAGRDRARDSAQSSATGRGATSATSSGLGGLGFSDVRLKENIELIGKSPSNINIYKFNYKNNPTTYQGAMAHEVPWASVKHSNGYMMVDYNLLDVDFKKYNA